MSKPVQKKADIAKLQSLVVELGGIIDYMPVIVYVMKASGCTYQEIGNVYGVSRQLAEYYTKKVESDILHEN